MLLMYTQDPDVIRAWVTPAGAMLCVDRRFTDWFGRGMAECAGRPFAAMSEQPARIEE